MRRHKIYCGAKEHISVIESQLDHHSGSCCIQYKTVFIKRLVQPKTLAERQHIHREKHATSSKTLQHQFSQSTHNCSSIIDFPPTPLQDTLKHLIIDQACGRMKADNISKTGCAICGELKPLRDMSQLKSVKHQLNILAEPGVSRVERKLSSDSLRELKGPILDYSYSMICNLCCSSIRKGKIPKHALANGLWIGDVPPQLKSLNFVEKMLVARI